MLRAVQITCMLMFALTITTSVCRNAVANPFSRAVNRARKSIDKEVRRFPPARGIQYWSREETNRRSQPETWYFGNGYFQRIDGRTWLEAQNGRPYARFTQRDPGPVGNNVIRLKNVAANVYVNLHLNEGTSHISFNDQDWKFLYKIRK